MRGKVSIFIFSPEDMWLIYLPGTQCWICFLVGCGVWPQALSNPFSTWLLGVTTNAYQSHLFFIQILPLLTVSNSNSFLFTQIETLGRATYLKEDRISIILVYVSLLASCSLCHFNSNPDNFKIFKQKILKYFNLVL